jgi:hypothetical protein
MRLLTNLGLTRADASVRKELIQPAVDVAVKLDRQMAAGDSTAAERCLTKVRKTLTTGAAAAPHRIEDAVADIDHHFEMKNALPVGARMALGASSERLWPRVLHQKTGTKPALITDAPPTETKQ